MFEDTAHVNKVQYEVINKGVGNTISHSEEMTNITTLNLKCHKETYNNSPRQTLCTDGKTGEHTYGHHDKISTSDRV